MSERKPYHSPGGLLIYNGWGRPRPLAKSEALAYSAEVKREGLCGAMTPTKGNFAGTCVCTSSDPVECEEGGHRDSRHMVCWGPG